jgi:hypothetical protein
MNAKLVELHDSIKHDLLEWVYKRIESNRRAVTSNNRSYCEGYEQALYDMSNYLVGYINSNIHTV